MENENWLVYDKDCIGEYFSKELYKNEEFIFNSEKEAKLYKDKYDPVKDIINIFTLFEIKIFYKSGNSITGLFVKFDCKSENGKITKVEWKDIQNHGYSHPLYLNLDCVESIWVNKTGFLCSYNDKIIYNSPCFGVIKSNGF